MPRNLFTFNFNNKPKAFLLALAVILILNALELFVLPINFFTFRVYEALKVVGLEEVFPGPFYPNQHIAMAEEGDLGHHTAYAVTRPVEWYTDDYGYRDRSEDEERHDIVIVGDSNILCSGSTQRDMLSEQMERVLKVSVYPFSPASLDLFLSDERFIKNPPKTIILGCTERNIVLFKSLPQERSGVKTPGLIERFLRSHLYLGRLIDRIYKQPMKQYVKGRMEQAKMGLVRRMVSEQDRRETAGDAGLKSKMLFYQRFNPNQNISQLKRAIDYPPEKVASLVPVIQSYKQLLEGKGIRFIFLPIPNKETIFYDFFPQKKKPVFLQQLISALKNSDIEVIDTLSAFEEAYREKNILLYFTDDTHWNVQGITLTRDLIVHHLTSEIHEE